jgi:hypothetical protein
LLLLGPAVIVAIGGLFWIPGELASHLVSGHWLEVPISQGPSIARHAVTPPFDAVGGWPRPVQALIPRWLYYLLLCAELRMLAAGARCLIALREHWRVRQAVRLSWEDAGEPRLPRRHRL